MDSAIVVAIGKLQLFTFVWHNLQAEIKNKKINDKEKKVLRGQLKKIVEDLNDDIFFVPLDSITSEDDVMKILQSKIDILKKEILNQLKQKGLISEDNEESTEL